MKYTLSDKLIAYLALISGLTISAVAIWYSVAGLVSIFSAATIAIIVMGVALEVSKLIATVWLKLNWNRAPVFIRTYLLIAIAVLMLITSMGIFGFLSKAHSDQSLVSGDVQSKIAIYDEKIKTAKDNIDANRKALRQMDEAVDQVMGRSSDEKGADKAVALRRSQQKERARLQSEIAAEQKIITTVSEERAPIAAEVRKVEAEVGPIKYIAAFIYGDNPDANVLEKAVTWVIIIIVVVFDPLAVILLLASQYSFQWFRKQEEQTEDDKEQDVEEFFQRGKLVAKGLDADEQARLAEEANAKLSEIEKETDIEATLASVEETEVQQPLTADSEKAIEEIPIEQWNKMIAEAEKAAEEEKELEDHEILQEAHETEKEAMRLWKEDNPEGSLKHQRKLLERGVISEVPWHIHLKAKPDFTDNDAAEEAAKWAMEQVEKKKDLTYIDKEGKNQIVKSVSYEQNAEQSPKTLWARIKDKKGSDEQ
jgi:hypothetical protein